MIERAKTLWALVLIGGLSVLGFWYVCGCCKGTQLSHHSFSTCSIRWSAFNIGFNVCVNGLSLCGPVTDWQTNKDEGVEESWMNEWMIHKLMNELSQTG